MTFVPTYSILDERIPFEARYFNALVADIVAFASNIGGTDLSAPLVLSKAGQHLDGDGHSIYGFRRWLGYGTADVCVRDVTGYGAHGDGATDDLAAIQAAIDDLPSWGGAILFPPGTYMVSGTILMAGSNRGKQNVTLQGFGTASSIRRMATGSAVPMIEMGGLETGTVGQTLLGLDFDGNGLNQTAGTGQVCISMVNTLRGRVVGCSVHDSVQDGIHLQGAEDAQIYVVWIYDCLRHGINQGNVERVARGISLAHIMIDNPTEAGIIVGPIENSSLIDCHVIDAGTDGILVRTQSNLGSSLFSISACSAKAAGSSGIVIESNHSGAVVSQFVISGSEASGCGNDGIELRGSSGGQIRAFALNGNPTSGNTRRGIGMTAKVSGGVVSGNVVTNNLAAGTDGGIYINGPDEDEKINGLSITGNVCTTTDGGTQQYGIVLGANTEANTVVGNTVGDNTAGAISDSGVDNEIAHNPGF